MYASPERVKTQSGQYEQMRSQTNLLRLFVQNSHYVKLKDVAYATSLHILDTLQFVMRATSCTT